MSTVEEQVRRESERGSSVTLTRNAKGDTQLTVKAYSEDEPGALEYASTEAQRVYDSLVAKYGDGS